MPVSSLSAAGEDDLAAGLQHPRELVERGFRARNGGDDILRHHHIEGIVREVEVARVHDRELLDMAQPHLADAHASLFEHLRRDIDADDPIPRRIIPQRNAGADPDLEDASTDALGRLDRGLAAAVENRAEYDIVDRRPSVVRADDRLVVELLLSLHVSANRNRVRGKGVTPVALEVRFVDLSRGVPSSERKDPCSWQAIYRRPNIGSRLLVELIL